MKDYLKRVAVVLDIAINVLRGGDIETVSSSCGKRLKVRPCKVCGWICKGIETAFNGRWAGHCSNNIREPYK